MTDDVLRALWEKNRPVVLDRIAVVRRALGASAEGALTAELREAARSDAHKLAGALGMYGFPEGSDLALQLEGHFKDGTPLDHDACLAALDDLAVRVGVG